MTCHNCRIELIKAGFYGKNRVQHYKCQQCGKRFAEPQEKPFGEDVRLPAEKVTVILHCLVEAIACPELLAFAMWRSGPFCIF